MFQLDEEGKLPHKFREIFECVDKYHNHNNSDHDDSLQGRKKMFLDGGADLVGGPVYLGESGSMFPQEFFYL